MYCSHFGLHRPPFNNTPDPTFYFSTPEHEEALATLQYTTEERKGFVLVTGEVGAGKTLIGRMFLRQIEQQAETAVITNTHLSGRQLLAAVCAEFDLHTPPDAGNLEFSQILQEFLLEQYARNRSVVVLIDEAQNLADEAFEEIRMLGNLEADDAKLLQVCILGQPELRNRFAQPRMRQLDQRLFRRFHLTALSAQQTRQYIRHRLEVAGSSNSDLFTDEAMDRIHLASKGIPRLVNQLCDAAMLASYAEGRNSVDIEMVNEVCERESHRASPAAEEVTKESAARPTQPESRREAVTGPAAAAAVAAGVNEQALHGLAKSVQECVETVIEGQGCGPAEIAVEVPDWQAPSEPSEAQEPPIRETPRSLAQMTERCRRAREELERLARGEFEAEPPANRPDRFSPPNSGPSNGSEKRENAAPSPGRGRVAGFVDAVRRKCCRKVETRPSDRAPQSQPRSTLPMPQPPAAEVRNAVNEAAERMAEQLRREQTEAINAINAQIEERQRVIAALGQRVDSQFEATREALESLEKKAATSVDLNTAKAAHEAAISDMERRLEENTTALRQLSNAIEEKAKAESATDAPEFQALAKRVIEQARQLHDLRKRVLEQNASVAQILSDMRGQMASRPELDEVRAAQAETSRKILERLERNRGEVEEILDSLEERYVGLRDQIEAMVASKADAASLSSLQERHEHEFGELLATLGRQRHEMEKALDKAVNEWRQAQKALDERAAQAANKKELDEIRCRQAADAGRILEMLAGHRRDVERLAGDLDRRAGELLQRLNALPKHLATAEQIDAIRTSYSEQLTDLTSRLAACEAGFEKARSFHERGLRAVAGKALETARRVTILEGKSRPRRVRLELSPQAGVELGEMVATAQDQIDTLQTDMEQARQTGADLRQMCSTIQEAMRTWQETMEGSWTSAQSFLEDWQKKAREAKSGAEQMLQGWRTGAGEIREEAERLRVSARMAAEILLKMRQCHSVIESQFSSGEWETRLNRAETLASRLEQAITGAGNFCQQIATRTEQSRNELNACLATVSQQIVGRVEQSKNELAAYLTDCKKQLAERLAQFAVEQKQMDQMIESRRQLLANIAKSAGSLSEVIDAGRRFDEKRHPSAAAATSPPKPPPPVESREPETDTVEQIQWPRFRTHQTQAQAG